MTIRQPREVSTAWLTRILTGSGALRRGHVTKVEQEPLEGNWSNNAFLTLSYSSDARGVRPERLFIKTSGGFGASEVHYYTRDYIDMKPDWLPRCYDAEFDVHDDCYHLLLEDLSRTHEPVMHRTPTQAYGLALTDLFAAMHAHRWGAARLDDIGETLPTREDIDRFVAAAHAGLNTTALHYGDEIGPAKIARVERYIDEHPGSLHERLANPAGFCLIHGDANPTNILVPREGGPAPLYLIDRQPFDWSLTVFLGVYDLTHAIVHRWERTARRGLEMSLLRRYHKRLLEHGVTDYTWQQLLNDYVLCAGMGIYDAIERNAEGPNDTLKWLWLPMLNRALDALDDAASLRATY